jgi:rifampin ADP-ribosylating transferase
MLVPGRESNFEDGRVMNHVYFTATLDAAVWGAELRLGPGPRADRRRAERRVRGRRVTSKKFPVVPRSPYRKPAAALVGELVDWVGHSREAAGHAGRTQGSEAAGCSQIEDWL